MPIQTAMFPRSISKGQAHEKAKLTALQAALSPEPKAAADLTSSPPNCQEDCSAVVADDRSRRQRNANRVIAALAEIAFSDIREVFGSDGRILPLAEIPPQTRRAIAEYKARRRTSTRIGPNGEKVTETFEVVSVRFYSKLAALAALGRYLGVL